MEKKTWGGKRKGAGRKPGQLRWRAELVQYMDKEENKRKFYNAIQKKLESGDTKMITWLGDQLIGKATQTVQGDMNAEVVYNIIRGKK